MLWNTVYLQRATDALRSLEGSAQILEKIWAKLDAEGSAIGVTAFLSIGYSERWLPTKRSVILPINWLWNDLTSVASIHRNNRRKDDFMYTRHATVFHAALLPEIAVSRREVGPSSDQQQAGASIY